MPFFQQGEGEKDFDTAIEFWGKLRYESPAWIPVGSKPSD
jgi:hypothetical protein